MSNEGTFLRKTLNQKLSLNEIQTLCFDLKIDDEGLTGTSKPEKIVSLMRYLERRNKIDRLKEWLANNRPDISLAEPIEFSKENASRQSHHPQSKRKRGRLNFHQWVVTIGAIVTTIVGGITIYSIVVPPASPIPTVTVSETPITPTSTIETLVPTSESVEVPSSISCDISNPECGALIDLYELTDGDNWQIDESKTDDNKNQPWDETEDHCKWFGVNCEQGSVITIKLAKVGLNGPITDTISNLQKLEQLDLTDNNITGTIPEKIGQLSYLTHLMLGNNDLSGEVPQEISNLENLKAFHLFDVESGEPEDTGKKLTGNLPKIVSNLEASQDTLEELSLHGQPFEGGLPADLGDFKNLARLRLSDNNLTGSEIPPEFENLENLNVLNLDNTGIKGEIPENLGTLPLIELGLSNNNLTGTVPMSIWDNSCWINPCLRDHNGNVYINDDPFNHDRSMQHARILYLNNNTSLEGRVPNDWAENAKEDDWNILVRIQSTAICVPDVPEIEERFERDNFDWRFSDCDG